MASDSKWHVDKTVPIALIGAMAVQVAGFLFGAGILVERNNARFEKNETRLTILEGKMDGLAQVPTDVAVIKSEVANITDTLDRIEDELGAARMTPPARQR